MVEGKPSTCFRLVFTLRFQQCKYEVDTTQSHKQLRGPSQKAERRYLH